MKTGQRQLRVSRRVTASVLMHWQASAKNTIQREPDERGVDRSAVGTTLGLDALAERDCLVVLLADAVDEPEGRDEDLAGGEGPDDADADLPVETEGGDASAGVGFPARRAPR
jgi:hypothetical protein